MNEIPSIDPANEGDLLGAFKHILSKEMQGIDGMLPAKVVAFDRATNRATVQPLIMMLTTSDTTISRATVASLPVYQIGGGGFILNFNLNPGDLGWIKASDRDISLFLKSYKESAPNTVRKKNFSDAVFYPDVMTGYTIAGEDANNAVLQNLDGTVKISLSSTGVKILAASTIDFEAPTVNFLTDDINFLTTNIGIQATDMTIQANTATTGTITNNTTNIGSTHKHSQGTDSAGDTEQDTSTPI